MSNQRDQFSPHASDSAEALANNHAVDGYLRHQHWSEPENAHLWFIWQADHSADKFINESNANAIRNELGPFMPKEVFEIHGHPETMFAVKIWKVVTRYYNLPSKEDLSIPRHEVACFPCEKCNRTGCIKLDVPFIEDAEQVLGPLFEKPDHPDLLYPAQTSVLVRTEAFEKVNEMACALSEYPLLDDSDHSSRQYDDGLEHIKSEGQHWTEEGILPAGYRWERMVFSWLWDHNQASLEEDGHYRPDEEAIGEALYALGLMSEEMKKEWEHSCILGPQLWYVLLSAKGEICYFSGAFGALKLKRPSRRKSPAQRRRFMLRQFQRRLGPSIKFTAYLGCARSWVNTAFVTTQKFSHFRPELTRKEGNRLIHSFRIYNSSVVDNDAGKTWKQPGSVIDARRRVILEGLQAQYSQYQKEALTREARRVQKDREEQAAYEAKQRGHRIDDDTFRPREGLPGQTGAVCPCCQATVVVDLDTGAVSGTTLTTACPGQKR